MKITKLVKTTLLEFKQMSTILGLAIGESVWLATAYLLHLHYSTTIADFFVVLCAYFTLRVIINYLKLRKLKE